MGRKPRPLTPLTEEQRPLLLNPELLCVARKAAAHFSRGRPDLYGETLGSAYYGLMLAIQTYRPELGIKLKTYCSFRCGFQIRDDRRDFRPRGLRRRDSIPPPTIGNVNVKGETVEDFMNLIPSEDLPVGWEIESEDEVKALCRGLVPRRREAILRYWLYGEGQEEIAQAWHVSDSAVSQCLLKALTILRRQQRKRSQS